MMPKMPKLVTNLRKSWELRIQFHESFTVAVVKFNNFNMFWVIFTVQSAGDLQVLDFLELDRISIATFILNYLNHYESTIFQGVLYIFRIHQFHQFPQVELQRVSCGVLAMICVGKDPLGRQRSDRAAEAGGKLMEIGSAHWSIVTAGFRN